MACVATFSLQRVQKPHTTNLHPALQFFDQDRAGYECERALYRHPQIHDTLPPIHGGADNADGAVQSPSGFVYPPFLVLERGVSLSEWLTLQRSSLAVLNMFFDVAKQLVRLHRAGHVHRDLKPANLLWMLQTQCWKLIDFGISGEIGAHCHASTLFAGPALPDL